jgi:hypothetical protein
MRSGSEFGRRLQNGTGKRLIDIPCDSARLIKLKTAMFKGWNSTKWLANQVLLWRPIWREHVDRHESIGHALFLKRQANCSYIDAVWRPVDKFAAGNTLIDMKCRLGIKRMILSKFAAAGLTPLSSRCFSASIRADRLLQLSGFTSSGTLRVI